MEKRFDSRPPSLQSRLSREIMSTLKIVVLIPYQIYRHYFIVMGKRGWRNARFREDIKK